MKYRILSLPLLIVIFIIFPNTLKCQDYFPFPSDSATWYSMYSWPEMIPPYVSYYTIKYEVIDDTILNNNTYHKAYKSIPDSIDSDLSYIGAYRVANNNKVFFIEEGEEYEVLLYDFNLVPGDTLSLENEVILTCIDTSTIYLDNIPHLSYDIILDQPMHTCYTTWVQGIGSLRMPFETSIFCGVSFEWAYDLTCYFYKDDKIYEWEMNPYFTGCIGHTIVGIEEQSIESLQVVPNPVQGISKLLGNKNNHQKINYQVLDLTGNIISEHNNILHSEIEIKKSDYTPGVYFIKIYPNDLQKAQVIKFLIK